MRIAMIFVFVAALVLSAWTDNSKVASGDRITNATIAPLPSMSDLFDDGYGVHRRL